MRVLFACLILCSACWSREVEQAAHATNAIDEQVAVWVTECTDAATNWDEHDECIRVGAYVGRLRQATLALDAARGRQARRAAACQWFQIVHTLPDVPAVVVAKRSKWRRKC
jgi:hypothetical protein